MTADERDRILCIDQSFQLTCLLFGRLVGRTKFGPFGPLPHQDLIEELFRGDHLEGQPTGIARLGTLRAPVRCLAADSHYGAGRQAEYEDRCAG